MELGAFTFAEVQRDPHTGQGVTATQRLRDVVEQAQVADHVGLDIFGVGEHHRVDYAATSPQMVLAAIAARTARIRLTSAVTVLSSADPVAIFEQFTALDLLSGGRAEIIAGRGAFVESFPLYGFDVADYDALYDEKLKLLLCLRDQEIVDWTGRFRPPLRSQPIQPRPVQPRLPVSVGVGGSTSSMLRAASLGLPIVVGIIGGNPTADFAPLVDIYRDHAAATEQDPAALTVTIAGHAFIARTSQQAADTFYPYYRAYLGQVFGGSSAITRESFDRALELDGHLLVGSPSQVVDKIAYQHRYFGNQCYLAQISLGSLPHGQAIEAIELLGSEVAPAVRGL
jgi:probable LLM family oxidoreductase